MADSAHSATGSEKIIDFFDPKFKAPEAVEHATDTHRKTFEKLMREVELLPKHLQSAERLCMALRLIDEAAYDIAEQRDGEDCSHLFLVAASVEQEIRRITDYS